jgi:hypothetical protein
MMVFILSIAAPKPSSQTCIHVLSNFQLHHVSNGKVNLNSNHLLEALSLEKCSADHARFQVLVPCSGWN